MTPTYLVRDRFTSAQNPLVDGSASDTGTRDVTGTSFYAAGGRLRGGNNSSEGKISYGGHSRVGGRTFCALVSPDDADGNVSIWLAETENSLNGYGLRVTSKTFEVVDQDAATITSVVVDGNGSAKATQYLMGITLNDTFGAIYWVSAAASYTPPSDWEIPAYPDARILYVTTLGTATTLYPTVRAQSGFTYPGGVAIEDVRLFDVSDWSGEDGMALAADRFNRADSSTTLGASWTADAGTWGVISNKAYSLSNNARAVMNAGVDDYWVVVTCDVATVTSDRFGLTMRRSSSTTRTILSNEDTANIYWKSWLSDSFDDFIYSTYGAFTNSSVVRYFAGVKANSWRFWQRGGNDTVMQPNTGPDSDHITGAYAGLSGDTNTRWDNFAIYNIIEALPSADFDDGAVPYVPASVGATLISDTFTDTNGTNITAHTPNVGGSWAVSGGTWQITSNALVVNSGASPNLAYIDAGEADVQVTVTLTMPGSFSTGQIRNGFVLRRADANNFVVVRCFMDDVNQLNNDEIEIEEYIGGSPAVVHKCYLDNFWTVSTSYTLKAQLVGDLLQIYLNGIHQLSTYLSNSALLSGTQHGVVSYAGTEATSWDTFLIESLAQSVDDTANGDTFVLTNTIVAGGAGGGVGAATLTLTNSMTAGSAEGGGSATANGATLTLTESLIAGSAEGVANVTASGATLTLSLIQSGGSASAGGNGTASGSIIVNTLSLIAGSAYAVNPNGTAAGATFTFSLILISATNERPITQNVYYAMSLYNNGEADRTIMNTNAASLLLNSNVTTDRGD